MTSAVAPFPAPVGPGIKVKSGHWELRELPPGISDGDETKWPKAPYRPSDERNYLVRLAQDWAERDGTARPDLPKGYGCFEMDQPGGPQVYKRLFGHPSGRFYDSIRRFETHFFWLLDGRSGKCECMLCGNFKPAPGPLRPRVKLNPVAGLPTTSVPKPLLKTGLPRVPMLNARASTDEELTSGNEATGGMGGGRRGRPDRYAQSTHPTDEEGTSNEFRKAIDHAYKQEGGAKEIDFDIKEENSIDWLSEIDSLPVSLTQIEAQHSFIPRRGELVLWIPDFPENQYLLRNAETGEYQFYDFHEKKYTGFPRWRAGVVVEVPVAAFKNGVIDFPDILDLPLKKTSLNTAGFRIETMPDPNDDDEKSLSKQYRYVALRNIRPLAHWQLLLKGIPQKTLHRSILHALTCMTSVSLVGRRSFIGHWRRGGYIRARACFLGSEMITLGDTIRLTPHEPNASCMDILVVDDIRFKMTGFKPEHLEYDSQLLCSSSQLHFVGKAYTLDRSRAHIHVPSSQAQSQSQSAEAAYVPHSLHSEDVKEWFRPVGTGEYGKWYPLQGDYKKFEVSYDQVLGRLYEADAIRLWSGLRQRHISSANREMMKPDLGFDTSSIIGGRRYATKTDERIPDVPESDPKAIRWVLSDYRAQSLSLATINGLETAAYNPIRTPATLAEWRAHIDISEGRQPTKTLIKAPRKRPKYRFDMRDFGLDDGAISGGGTYTAKGTGGGGRRGRPAGSKLIDGKIYTAEMLRNMTNIPTRGKTLPTQAGMTSFDHEDIEEEDDEGEQSQDSEKLDHPAFHSHSQSHQPAFKSSSQLAGAALNENSDDEESDPQARPPPRNSMLAAAYAFDSDENDQDKRMPDITVEDFKLAAAALNHKGKAPTRLPPSKAQIMQSVEEGEDSALENIGAPDMAADDFSDEEEEEEEEEEEDLINYDSWKTLRNARGGTEESEGGDYRPGESQ
ncbi:hypothetical protein LTR05_001898 [Lithohypha guttulata]|uniref:Uncharacterized protein n=1 Tax=Lithohypha guttulata TaxID=1690604 RepID=A0AAN7YKK4_9EURO|nr:hypothetical protein LTR05_001898 [Lithohypha guttulata]